MAISVANLTAGISTSDPATTASVTPTAGAVLLLAVTVAADTTSTAISVEPAGLTGTWVKVGEYDWRSRRTTFLFTCDDWSGSGTISLDPEVTGTPNPQETGWVLDEATGLDPVSPVVSPVFDGAAGGTSTTKTLTNSGSPGAGDATWTALALENNVDLTIGAEWSALGATTTGSLGVRRIESAWSSAADLTANWSWNASAQGNGGVIVILADGGGPLGLAGGPAAEADAATVAALGKTLGTGQVAETDTARAATTAKVLAAGPAAEADTARPATMGATVTLAAGVASEEVDAATLPLRKVLAAGPATGVSSAHSATATKAMAGGMVSTTDTAGPATNLAGVPLGPATETDTARAATTAKVLAAGPAAEADTARPATMGGAGLDEDFLGANIPAGWAEQFPRSLGAISYAGDSRALILVPTSVHDSIFSTGSPDQSVGLTVAVPSHGGDVDMAVQVDTDVSDRVGQALNLLLFGAGSDAARFTWYHSATVTEPQPRHFAYARAGGVGAAIGSNPLISTYMTGLPSWLRVRYTATTGAWEALDSADGATWTSRVTGTRSFTPTTFKFGVSNNPATTAALVRLNRVVDVLAFGSTDLRAAPPATVIRTPVATIDGTSLPVGWVNESVGSSSVASNGSALVFTHDATQDNDPAGVPSGSARIRWTGAGYRQWGITAKVTVPTGNTQCFLTIGAGRWDGAWLDQYGAGPGYVLEVALSTIRRPLRVDDPADATVVPTSWPTGLDEVAYCMLAERTGQTNLTGGAVRWFRVERVGKRIRMREWADGSTEPTTWDLIDAQDEVEDGAHAPYFAVSHNGVRTGSAVVHLDDVQYYAVATVAIPSSPSPESDQAGTATMVKALAVAAPGTEVDATRPASMASVGLLPTGLTMETDAAGPAGIAKAMLAAGATEADMPRPASMVGPGGLAIGLVTEASTARAASITKALVLGRPSESDSARPATFAGAVAAWSWLVSRGGILRPHDASVSDGSTLHPATATVT